MIADGFGPASLTLARTASEQPLRMDEILVGSVATASADSHITDSASSATALASGHDTNNRVIGLDPDGAQLGNLMERAQAAGLLTGVVTTTAVTHATPAAFSAHIMSRDDEQAIALQQLGCELDLLLGGGQKFFLPKQETPGWGSGKRLDGRNLLDEAPALGWHVVTTPPALKAATELPLLGLFTAGHLAYRLDVRARSAQGQPSEQPTLAQMTAKALALLSAHDEPFVLLVEGGRIDHAAHDNDVASHLLEILDYDAALGVALDFAADDGRTLVVSVSDHETGGLSIGRNRGLVGLQNWNPELLSRQTASLEQMQARMKAGERGLDVFREVGGVPDLDLEEAERIQNADALVPGLSRAATEDRAHNGVIRALMAPLAKRAGVGWGTFWHTAVDVPLFADGVGRERLVGHHSLRELGVLLRELLGLADG